MQNNHISSKTKFNLAMCMVKDCYLNHLLALSKFTWRNINIHGYPNTYLLITLGSRFITEMFVINFRCHCKTKFSPPCLNDIHCFSGTIFFPVVVCVFYKPSNMMIIIFCTKVTHWFGKLNYWQTSQGYLQQKVCIVKLFYLVFFLISVETVKDHLKECPFYTSLSDCSVSFMDSVL